MSLPTAAIAPFIALVVAPIVALSGCGQEAAPYASAPKNQAPDIKVAWGVDSGASSGSSSGVADAGSTADGASSGGASSGGASSGGADSGTSSGTTSSGGSSGGDTTTGPTDTGGGTSGASSGSVDAGSGSDADQACGDALCDAKIGESCSTCPADCGDCCGDGKCDLTKFETCTTCEKDCGPCKAVCGDGKCEKQLGETCMTCKPDCGSCPATCGDGKCETGIETCATCAKDCGPCKPVCGDGKCEAPTENAANCAKDCVVSACKLPCDPVTFKGCVGAAVQCYPNPSLNSASCASVGKKSKGQACTAPNECKKGMLCVNQLCLKVCDTSGATGVNCGAGETCDKLVSGGKELPCNIGACFGNTACNLLTSTGCPATHNCMPSGGGKKQCVPVGKKALGATCTVDAECPKATMCISTGANKPKNCLRKCHFSGGNPKCPSGFNCATVTSGNPPKPVGDFLGVCTK